MPNTAERQVSILNTIDAMSVGKEKILALRFFIACEERLIKNSEANFEEPAPLTLARKYLHELEERSRMAEVILSTQLEPDDEFFLADLSSELSSPANSPTMSLNHTPKGSDVTKAHYAGFFTQKIELSGQEKELLQNKVPSY